MSARTDFPPVRACLFDLDGLLLDTEDLYTACADELLAAHGRPALPWSVKAQLQGRPGPAATALFLDWARLPISAEAYQARMAALQRRHFPAAQPLPGVERLLADLDATRRWEEEEEWGGDDYGDGDGDGDDKKKQKMKKKNRVHLALATSSHAGSFALKTAHLPALTAVFAPERRVLGDDARLAPGRGKPLPDIYLAALGTINAGLAAAAAIRPEECLVFEDSVPGVEAGRRAGMRVVWCPHPGLKQEYAGREADVLAGRLGMAGGVDEHQLGERDDGWAHYMPSLVKFPYETYGISIPPAGTDQDGTPTKPAIKG